MSMIGVSLAQPGPWSILRAGCRLIDLPACIAPPKHRGEVLLHAAQTCNHDAFDEANRVMLRSGVLPAGMCLPWRADLPRGGFVARATIGAVATDHVVGVGVRYALILADVTPLPVFVPGPAPTTTAMLFQLDGDVFERALAAAVAATTDAELAAVASVWREAPRVRRCARAVSIETMGTEARV
jgi:hypothetical protein